VVAVHLLILISLQNYLAYGHGGQVMPALWFRYDLSPITVAYTEKRQPFYHFLTMVRALVDHMLLSVYYCMC